MSAKRLENKVAIVTGAGCVGHGWGNGRAVCVRLAEEGARIFAVDRDWPPTKHASSPARKSSWTAA